MRLQLALNVRNLDEAIDYRGKLSGAKVNKRKPGYANFSISATAPAPGTFGASIAALAALAALRSARRSLRS